jgi:hypothetical protein
MLFFSKRATGARKFTGGKGLKVLSMYPGVHSESGEFLRMKARKYI